jgi:hypothetical protein
MKAHVNKLIFITLHRDGLRGLETFRYKFVLNVHFRSSFFFSFSLESYSYMIFLARGCTPRCEGASGGTVASEA